MTAVTLAAEAGIIARAQAVAALIDADPEFPWARGEHDRKVIIMCAAGAREGLGVHAGLLAGRIHPADEFPELGPGWPDDAMATALERVTEDIRAWTGALVLAVREKCGDGIASRMEAAADEAAAKNGGES